MAIDFNCFGLLFCWGALGVSAIMGQEKSPEENPFDKYLVSSIFNEKVRQDLELIDDQKQEIKSLMDNLLDQQKALSQDLQAFSKGDVSQQQIDDRRKEAQQKFESHKQHVQTSVMSVLLPRQRERLREATAQVVLRESAKKNKVPTGILAPEMLKYLQIDDAQAEKIKRRAAAIQKRLAEKIKKLTEAAQAELLGELDSEQQSKYKKLVGHPLR